MVLSTSTLRLLYAPACRTKGSLYQLAYAALDSVLKKYDYAVRSGESGAYNCRTITGGTGYSLHAYGPGDRYVFWNGTAFAMSLAVDINPSTNPYGSRLITDMPRAMVDAIEAIRTNSGAQVWAWGGYYSGNKDAMHYEIVCSPADLNTGINQNTVQSGAPTPIPTPITEEERIMLETVMLAHKFYLGIAATTTVLAEKRSIDYWYWQLLSGTPEETMRSAMAATARSKGQL